MTTPTHPTGVYIKVADALVAGGGLIMFLFSFAPFVTSPSVTVGTFTAGGYHKNAWGLFTPVLLFVVFAAILLVGTAFVDTFWHRDKQYVGLNRHVVQVGLALYALVSLLGWALADKQGLSFGWGGIFMFIGSLIAAAGAILNHLNMMQNPLAIPTGGKSVTPPAYYPPTQPTATDPATAPVDPTV